MRCLTLVLIPDSPVIVASPSTDDRAAPANEVSEAKHNINGNNKSEAAAADETVSKVADNDRKKNAAGIAEAREKYKFDVSGWQ